MVVITLMAEPCRFNDLKRKIGGVSQQMLTRTLKALEVDGLVARAVEPTTPPKVEYSLTALGLSFSNAIAPLVAWAVENSPLIVERRKAHVSG